MFNECMLKYGFRQEDIHNLSCSPSKAEVDRVFQQIASDLKAGKRKIPMKKYLIMCLFAGHGFMIEGQQVVIFNEYDQHQRFYKAFKAESRLRCLAELYPNSYIVGIFACCRQTQPSFYGQCISKEKYELLTAKNVSNDKLIKLHMQNFEQSQKAFMEN